VKREPPTPAGAGGGKAQTTGRAVCSRTAAPAEVLRLDPRFRGLTRHLHRLARDHDLEPALVAKLEVYADLDAVAVPLLGACDWPSVPVSVVA
jgi:hypothetical protein